MFAREDQSAELDVKILEAFRVAVETARETACSSGHIVTLAIDGKVVEVQANGKRTIKKALPHPSKVERGRKIRLR